MIIGEFCCFLVTSIRQEHVRLCVHFEGMPTQQRTLAFCEVVDTFQGPFSVQLTERTPQYLSCGGAEPCSGQGL